MRNSTSLTTIKDKIVGEFRFIKKYRSSIIALQFSKDYIYCNEASANSTVTHGSLIAKHICLFFMKTLTSRKLPVVLFLLLINTNVYPQFPRYINIFNYTTDARLAGMGGDNQGSLDGPSYMFPIRENMSSKNVMTSFSFRPPNWNSSDFLPFHTIGVQKDFDSSTTTGLYVARNTSGIQIPISQNVKTFHGNVEPYQLYIVGFLNFLIDDDLSIGLAVKYYTGTSTPFIFFGLPHTDGRIQGSATMIDIAFQKRYILAPGMYTNKILYLRGGFSNFGTWIRYNDNLTYQVPRSFHLDAMLSEQGETFSFLYNVHTRMILNAISNDERYFFNTGMETGYKDVLFGRAGILINPYKSLFGSKDSPRLTFGAGVKLKSRILSDQSRFELMMDLAAVPLTKADYPGLMIRDNSINYVFSITLIYPIALSAPR